MDLEEISTVILKSLMLIAVAWLVSAFIGVDVYHTLVVFLVFENYWKEE